MHVLKKDLLKLNFTLQDHLYLKEWLVSLSNKPVFCRYCESINLYMYDIGSNFIHTFHLLCNITLRNGLKLFNIGKTGEIYYNIY